jgi:WS/DGAT/MGAT family acyltransferase
VSRDREPLSAIDSAWLRMEDPTNLMTITGVMSFEEPVPFEVLKEVIEDRFLAHRRFRQRVVESKVPFRNPRWEDDEHFSLSRHLHRTALPAPGDQKALEALVSDLMSTPLDLSRPLWQMHHIENYRGGTAVVGRIHHTIGDGLALMPVLLDMTETAEGVRASEAATSQLIRKKPAPREEQPDDDGPMELPKKVLDAIKMGGGAAWTLGKLVALPADPSTPFKGELGTAKKAAWSDAIPLDDIKALGRRLGATINDVLLSAVSGALRFHLEERGIAPERDLQLRAVVPVNLRPPGDTSLGNRFGLVFLPLPLGTADPLERLKKLKERMDEIKRSPEAGVTYAVLQAMGATSENLEEQALRLFGKKATAVATNVPGPREPLYMHGRRMRSLMFWVPQSGRLGLGVSILSYAGTVRVGIATDAGLLPDPGQIVAAYHRALEELDGAVGGG